MSRWMNVGEVSSMGAYMYPEKIAVKDSRRSLTYKELNDRANRLANALTDLGLSKGDKFAIIAYNRFEWMEIYTAAAKAGLVAVPIMFRLEPPEYQYILEGFDRTWSRWTSETHKDYTHIPEGWYTFRVRSKNIFGETSDEASISFLILAPWFRSSWAYFAAFVFLVMITYFSVRTVINRTRQKAIAERMKVYAIEKAAVEKLRSRVAADFHDELGNRITRISLFGEILLSSLKDRNETAQKYINKIIDNADTLYNETRDFIWQLDPKKDSLYDVSIITNRKIFGIKIRKGN